MQSGPRWSAPIMTPELNEPFYSQLAARQLPMNEPRHADSWRPNPRVTLAWLNLSVVTAPWLISARCCWPATLFSMSTESG